MGNVKKYVIIGNGIAGLSAAETIRKRDEEGQIIMVSAEKYLTYYRVKLSHFISRDFLDKELLIHDEKWYEDRKIDIRLGKAVVKIDGDKKIVALEDGSTIEYDELLLANGSRPFIPPIKGNEKKGVFALRTIDDLKEAQQYFKNCNNITVLGGGLLGLEVAWAIKELNKEVNIVEFFPYLLPRQLDEGLSKEFGFQLEEKGLNLYLGTATEEILGEDQVTGLRLQDGRIVETDAVLISAGVRPILDLVQGTELAFEKGVKVNKYMATNLPHVYAAGDVAELDGMVIGLWSVSSDQGKIAGENMTGGDKIYRLPELNTMLSIGGLSVFSAGKVKDFDRIAEMTDPNKKACYKLYIAGNKVIGGVVMNDMAKVPKVKKMVSNNMDLTEQLERGMELREILETI